MEMAQPREKYRKQPTKKLMKLYGSGLQMQDLEICRYLDQAKDIAEKLGKTDFHASNGWIESFRKRHGIYFKAVCGEAGDVLDETVNTWIKKLKNSLKAMNSQNLYVLKKQSVIVVNNQKNVSQCSFVPL
ncbi:hypothetical protein AVEN_208655-1 [Araneus ventricosus]|uniref:HTH CENPB-type domain-containing protein n=1 Tax=Araneus ventricosus TaxID=182803 RepID=A0A4Y2DSI0_ARAVE|nr:hypothetical protein AVEN_208655-1 [Araneus ventricosus]